MSRSLILLVLVMGVLLAGCVTMSPGQLAQYSAALATNVAVSQATVYAMATEAVALAETATVTALLALTPTPTVTNTPTPSPTSTPTPVPTDTPTPTATASPTLTPTPVPTVTPSPTSTPTPVPTATPTPTVTASPTLTPTPTPQPEAFVRVTGNVRVNVRSGPGLAWEPFTTIPPGQDFRITGTNDARSWWRICCVDGDKTGWVSGQVVTARGELDAIPVILLVLPEDLSTTWRIRWECYSPGCKFDVCEGQSVAKVRKVLNERWLEIERKATWEGQCGEPSTWILQVDRYSGEERPLPGGEPLFRFFEGWANLGEANRTFARDEEKIPMWCTAPRSREEERGDGWTVIFEGEACYDLRSGMLFTISYTKRWLFTGTFEGKQYERQYFGDYEVYEQTLKETNVALSPPQKK